MFEKHLWSRSVYIACCFRRMNKYGATGINNFFSSSVSQLTQLVLLTFRLMWMHAIEPRDEISVRRIFRHLFQFILEQIPDIEYLIRRLNAYRRSVKFPLDVKCAIVTHLSIFWDFSVQRIQHPISHYTERLESALGKNSIQSFIRNRN